MKNVIGSFAFVLVLFLASPEISAQERVNPARAGQSSRHEHPVEALQKSVAELAVESFEGTAFPPEGWKKETNFGGVGWVQADVDSLVVGFSSGSVDAPDGGGAFVALASWVTGDADSNFTTDQAADQWLITPQIMDIQPTDSLRFYLRYFSRFPDNIDVWISDTGDSLAAFDTLVTRLSFSGTGDNDWRPYSFALKDFAPVGSDIYIAFREHVRHTAAEGGAFFLDLVEAGSLITTVAANSAEPYTFELLENYPNPFNPSTKITFALPEESQVTLQVFNLLGQVVATPVDRLGYERGRHQVAFDGSGLPNGVYFYQVTAGQFRAIKKMTLLR